MALATSYYDGTRSIFQAIVRRTSDGEVLWRVQNNHEPPTIQFHPSGKLLAIGNDEGSVYLRRVTDGKILQTINTENGIVILAFSPRGEMLATGGSHLSFWRVLDGALLRSFAIPGASSLAFSPDGRTIVTGGSVLQQWRVSDGALLYSISFDHFFPVTVVFSPDGKTLATSHSNSNSLYFLRAVDGTVITTYEMGEYQAFQQFDYSPDGSRLAYVHLLHGPPLTAFGLVSAVPIVAGPTIAGTIHLPYCVHPDEVFLTFAFQPEDGTTLYRTPQRDANGGFTLDSLPPGKYTLKVKARQWLQKAVPIDTTAGNALGLSLTLIPGDANDDNSVDIFDLATLAEAFNTLPLDLDWNPETDFNRDERVDLYDLAILAESFNQSGDL